MCVILQIEPGTVVPADKLARACDINKHGHGIAYVHKGELKLIRSVANNDPKEIAATLERLRSHRVFLHLRHATVGPVTLANNHPMIVWHHAKRSIAMMHNGTLRDYNPPKDSPMSDTAWFTSQWVSPLVQRIITFASPKGVLTDPIFQKAITKEAGFSVLVFFDSWGNVFRVNDSHGKQFDGFWASNEYSFNDNHARSSASSWRSHSANSSSAHTGSTRYHGGAYGSQRKPQGAFPFDCVELNDLYEEDDLILAWEREAAKQDNNNGNGNTRQTVLTLPDDDPLRVAWSNVDWTTKNIVPYLLEKAWPYLRGGGQADLRNQVNVVSRRIQTAKLQENSIMNFRDLSVKRVPFLEQAGLKSFDDLGRLTFEDLSDLCSSYPDAMAQLVIDLYHESNLANVAKMSESIRAAAAAEAENKNAS